mgnify:CR=1 FL=1
MASPIAPPAYLARSVCQIIQNAISNPQNTMVVSTLKEKFNSTAGVNMDSEMSNLIQVQNTYSANAHIMSVVQSMMQSLLQAYQ